jgi:hypothetical protein
MFSLPCAHFTIFLKQFFPFLVAAVASWFTWFSEADYILLLLCTLCLCVVPDHKRRLFCEMLYKTDFIYYENENNGHSEY